MDLGEAHELKTVDTAVSIGSSEQAGAGVLQPSQTANSSVIEDHNSISPLFPRMQFSASRDDRGSWSSNQPRANVDDFSRWLNDEHARDNARKLSKTSSSGTAVTGPFGSSDGMLNETSGKDVFHVVDDAASSICIDDNDDGTDMRRAIIDALRGTTNPLSGEGSEFEQYTHRIAREMIVKEKSDRRLRRTKDSRMYGNYFSAPSAPEEATTKITPSHHFDSFNGRRQNSTYNHQLNQLNTPYTYEERERRHERMQLNMIPENLIEDMPDELSLVTMDIDDLESDTFSLSSEGSKSNKPRLKRKLLSRHLQILALGGSLGVGNFLHTGQSLFRSGPLGAFLGCVLAGLIVLAAMVSLGEMVSLLPSDRGIASFASRFVDKSLGFALGVCYWFSCAMALPSEVTGASIMISNYPMLDNGDKSIVVWVTFFLMIIVLVNLFDVGVFGELQSLATSAILCCLVLLIIFLCAANAGSVAPYREHVGFRYWDISKSNVTSHQLYGPFRPSYALKLHTETEGEIQVLKGIGGSLGNFIQLWTAICDASFSFIGTELVFTMAGEVRNPRRAIPSATKKIFWRVGLWYCLSILVVGINVYAGDPRLIIGSGNVDDIDGFLNRRSSPTYVTSTPPEQLGRCESTFWSSKNFLGATGTPWTIALQSAGQCSTASAANAVFIISSVLSGVSHLYAASRTLYGLSIQGQLWKGFARCSNAGVPYVAVLFSFMFSLIAYLTSNSRSALVLDWFMALSTSAGLVVWAGCCFSFLRFFRGLKLRPDVIDRNDETYPFKSPFQPYLAYFGLVMSILVALFMGLPVFLSDQWVTGEFFATYTAEFVFVLCFCGHKAIYRTRLIPLNRVDLDSGRKEVENAVWDEDRVYSYGLLQRGWDAYYKVKHWLVRIR